MKKNPNAMRTTPELSLALPGLLDLDVPNLVPKNGIVSYYYPFYDPEKSQAIFEELLHSVDWIQDEMKMYDRIVPLPRLIARYGDETGWLPLLLEIKKDVEAHTGLKFNYVLLNLYRDHNDHVSWHSDRYKHKDDIKVIASLSFGEERKFQLRHKTDKSLKDISLDLKPGSLVVMNEIQDHWLHRIAKTSKAKGPRINLTFRKITVTDEYKTQLY